MHPLSLFETKLLICRCINHPINHCFTLEPILEQTTVKKDQSDARSGKQEELWEEIRTAYRHPALRPVNMDGTSNPNTESLLPSTSTLTSV